MKSATLVVLAIGAIVSTCMAIPTAGELYPGNSKPVAVKEGCTLLGAPTFKSNTFDIYKDCINVGNGELKNFAAKSKLLPGPFKYTVIKSATELNKVVEITQSVENQGTFLVFVYINETPENKGLLAQLERILLGKNGSDGKYGVAGIIEKLVLVIIEALTKNLSHV